MISVDVMTETYTPSWTDEQTKIIHHELKPGHVSLIEGFAGCSKTTTLFQLCKQNWGKRILYFTFNRSLMESSKEKFKDFPHVTIDTFHSFALRELTRSISVEDEPPIEVIDLIQVSDAMEALHTEDYENVAGAIRVLERFCSTVDETILPEHAEGVLPRMAIPELSVRLARKLFALILAGRFPYPHDLYMKRYMDLHPNLIDYDVVLVDEAQDITPLQLDFVLRQKHASMVLVGDPHQTLYTFRFVCNPFEAIPDMGGIVPYERFRLSKSFRFGSEVSDFSTRFLRHFKDDASIQIQSHGSIAQDCTQIEANASNLPRKRTHLFRTNRGMVKDLFCMAADPDVRSVHVLGNAFVPRDEIRALHEIQAVVDKNYAKPFKNPLMATCTTLRDLRNLFGSIRDFRGTLRVDLVRELGMKAMIRHWECVDEKNEDVAESADIVLGTVHQAKGLEFDHVVLGDDFPTIETVRNLNVDEKKKNMVDILNIYYVAMTRPRKALYLNRVLRTFGHQDTNQTTLTEYFT